MRQQTCVRFANAGTPQRLQRRTGFSTSTTSHLARALSSRASYWRFPTAVLPGIDHVLLFTFHLSSSNRCGGRFAGLLGSFHMPKIDAASDRYLFQII